MLGSWEVIVILLVVLVLFGGKKLPDFARNLGKGMREFKKATSGEIEPPSQTSAPITKNEQNCADTALETTSGEK